MKATALPWRLMCLCNHFFEVNLKVRCLCSWISPSFCLWTNPVTGLTSLMFIWNRNFFRFFFPSSYLYHVLNFTYLLWLQYTNLLLKPCSIMMFLYDYKLTPTCRMSLLFAQFNSFHQYSLIWVRNFEHLSEVQELV